ncbi:class I adenylate-forming enzyme family protein [Thauera sinica]|uniref:Class I adenylate-forming enzyme family protein n=1 Tax=Thauera sinica TaxID=2665146 RepID=A0ABW1ANW9_9RHOO|nr:class I adenylate-forming enzyme family protein [Thauera sp. K11]ATE62813.1 AMP-dependent synthetase [Thauera sp. K11]
MLPRDLIKRCARNYPNKTAYYMGEHSATWRRMDERSDWLAAGLQKLGIGKGDAIGVLSQESIEIYEQFMACMKIGAVRVGINWRYASEEVLHCARDSGIRALVVQGRLVEQLKNELERFADAGVLVIGYDDGHGLDLDYEAIIDQGRQRAVDYPALDRDDTLFVTYTSGTSGLPKGVVLSHGGLHDVILHSVLSVGLGPDDVWYMPAASSWVVIAMNVWGLANGMAHVIPEGAFDVKAYLRDVERHRVTVVMQVPTTLRWLMREFATGQYDFSSVRLLVFGSSPASPELIHQIHGTWPDVGLLQTYGQTEVTGGWVTFMTPADYRLAFDGRPELLKSVGRVGLHFELTVRDDEGKELPPGETGELWMRGTPMMKGYQNLPEKTREVMPGDGWLRSHDIVSIDADGYVYLHDRKNFLIITGAVNVFPSSVEAVVMTHSAVEEVAVIGVPHPEWGEAVVAVVKPKDGESLAADELIDFCRSHLSKPETPKHVLIVDHPLPKTLTAKLQKAEIRRWVLDDPKRLPWSVAEAK